MSDLVALPLPDGRWLALSPAALREALAAGSALGLAAVPTPVAPAPAPEKWATSEQIGELIGVHSTTVEGWAKAGTIPSVRCGKALRFEPGAVKAALRAANCNART